MNNKHRPIATIVLVLAGMVFLLTYPFREYWWMGLVMHMSGAAMIGGLADWYAVEALFGKPLGISYKTALIVRRRDRLIEMARAMVMKELLTMPHMYRVLKEENVVVRVTQYMVSKEAIGQWQALEGQWKEELLSKGDWQTIKEMLNAALSKGLRNWPITPLLLWWGRLLWNEPTFSLLWKQAISLLRTILQSPVWRPLWLTLGERILHTYQSGNPLRAFAMQMAGDFLSADTLVDTVLKKADLYLHTQSQPNSTLYNWAQEKGLSFLQELESNPARQQWLEVKKNELVERLLSEESLVTEERLRSLLLTSNLSVSQRLEAYGRTLAEDEMLREQWERYLLKQMVPLLQWIRPLVESAMVREMEAYTGPQLAAMLKEKVYYDLQMIRLNGSMVGGLLGGLFYILASLGKGGW